MNYRGNDNSPVNYERAPHPTVKSYPSVYSHIADLDAEVTNLKGIVSTSRFRIQRLEKESIEDSSRFAGEIESLRARYYALLGLLCSALIILFIIICNIYFRLGVIPDMGV